MNKIPKKTNLEPIENEKLTAPKVAPKEPAKAKEPHWLDVLMGVTVVPDADLNAAMLALFAEIIKAKGGQVMVDDVPGDRGRVQMASKRLRTLGLSSTRPAVAHVSVMPTEKLVKALCG